MIVHPWVGSSDQITLASANSGGAAASVARQAAWRAVQRARRRVDDRERVGRPPRIGVEPRDERRERTVEQAVVGVEEHDVVSPQQRQRRVASGPRGRGAARAARPRRPRAAATARPTRCQRRSAARGRPAGGRSRPPAADPSPAYSSHTGMTTLTLACASRPRGTGTRVASTPANRMRVLVLTPYAYGTVPGPRSSFELWERVLREADIQLDYLVFETDGLHEVLYEPGRVPAKAWEMARSYARFAPRAIRRARDYDAVLVNREATLVGPGRGGAAGGAHRQAADLPARRPAVHPVPLPVQRLALVPEVLREGEVAVPDEHRGARQLAEPRAVRARVQRQRVGDSERRRRRPVHGLGSAPRAGDGPVRDRLDGFSEHGRQPPGDRRPARRRSPARRRRAAVHRGGRAPTCRGSRTPRSRGGRAPRSRICGRSTSACCRCRAPRGRRTSST